MGKDFADAFPEAKETFQEADDLLQERISPVIFEGPQELLTQTKYSQIGIFVTSMAILRVIRKQCPGLCPAVCSGLSLGEYTALCASSRLSFSETLLLVRERARLMNEACENSSGAMSAVLGLDSLSVEETLKELEGVWIANYNAPGQIVISGTREGVEKAQPLLKERGAKRVVPLVVHGAFHSPLMQSAQDGLTPFISAVSIQDSDIGFVMNVPGDFVRTSQEIKNNLICQVTRSVRWEQGILAMEGIELFLEVGCGKTLSGLNRKIGQTAPTLSIDKVQDLEQIGRLTCTVS